jgi:yecA family protein
LSRQAHEASSRINHSGGGQTATIIDKRRPISAKRWGGAAPEFETEDEMRTVLGTIMGRYNEIAACFGSSLNEFDPIFWEGPVGEIIASDWAGGFPGAVALRPEAWEAIIEHDRAGILIVPLLLLNGDIAFTGGPVGTLTEEEFLSESPKMIPTCIAGIHGFWRNCHKPPSSRSRSRSGHRRRR